MLQAGTAAISKPTTGHKMEYILQGVDATPEMERTSDEEDAAPAKPSRRALETESSTRPGPKGSGAGLSKSATGHSEAAQVVAGDFFAGAPDSEFLSAPSLLDEIGSRDGDGTATTCAESTPSFDDALALEVGIGAYGYLQQCFYTEVSVLDRKKFNAVQKITKSDFTILGHLGKGNFSDVFEVVCKGGQLLHAKGRKRAAFSSSFNTATLAKPQVSKNRRPVFALKCLRPQIRSDADQFAMGAKDLVHETAILSNLDHRHIIRLHGRASGPLANAFVLDDGYFILLDKLDETLSRRIRAWKWSREGAPRGPAEEQIIVAYSVADAMCYLHSRRIVFRDLKPANIGFDPAGVPKLFDFGFAAGLPEADEGNPAGLLYEKCGTRRYMAPEVGLSLGYGLPADVHSLGVLLWEIFSLDRPFPSVRTPEEFEARVFRGGERPTIDRRWPTAVKKLISRCWSGIPRKRPAMLEVKSTLSLAIFNGGDERKARRRAFRSLTF